MRIGEVFTAQRVLTQEDFNRFAELSGDVNPIHVNPEFSARTRFGRTVAHGMFLYSLICSALAAQFTNTRQVRQDLIFPSPSYVGEEVTVSLTVVELDEVELRARIKTLVTRPNGEIGCQGEMVMHYAR